MTENVTLARPYSKAIFQLAKASGQYEKWAELLKLLSMIITDSQALIIIQDPTLTIIAKADFVASIAPHVVDAEGKGLLCLLLEYDRLLLAPEIAALYTDYCAEENQTIAVDVCSAVPLDLAQQKMLHLAIAKHFNSKVSLNWQVDPGLIGGIIVKQDDKVLDGSIRKRLQLLHKELAANC